MHLSSRQTFILAESTQFAGIATVAKPRNVGGNAKATLKLEGKLKMEWLLKKTEFDGLPLHLRRPNYENIWEFKNEYTELICVTHVFESVMENGLPMTEYNETLIDFDGEIIEKFQTENNGIIFLIETFGGARRYWFYGKKSNSFSNIFESLKRKHPNKELELDIQNDDGWGFIKEYPVELY